MLGRRIDRLKRLVAASPRPVGLKLVAVELSPFGTSDRARPGKAPAITLPSRSMEAALPA
jgi:hypothetical protein